MTVSDLRATEGISPSPAVTFPPSERAVTLLLQAACVAVVDATVVAETWRDLLLSHFTDTPTMSVGGLEVARRGAVAHLPSDGTVTVHCRRDGRWLELDDQSPLPVDEVWVDLSPIADALAEDGHCSGGPWEAGTAVRFAVHGEHLLLGDPSCWEPGCSDMLAGSLALRLPEPGWVTARLFTDGHDLRALRLQWAPAADTSAVVFHHHHGGHSHSHSHGHAHTH